MAFSLSLIKELRIPTLEKYNFRISDSKEINTIENIKPINVVIGANNAGKSRFLRHLFSNDFEQFDSYATLIDKVLSSIIFNENDLLFGMDDLEFKARKNINFYLSDKDINLYTADIRELFTKEVLDTVHHYRGKHSPEEVERLGNKIFSDSLWHQIKESTPSQEDRDIKKVRKEYIPILRGLRTLDANTDVYLNRTINDYFKNSNTAQELNIFTGYPLYNELLDILTGSEEERQSLKQYEQYLSEHFFQGQTIEIVPRRKESSEDNSGNVVEIKIGNERQLPIYHLGDGIQAIICTTIRPFIEQTPTFFFIEEPEHYLHAGMQRALINAFRQCPQHRYFITTQSNHFVDLTLEENDINLISVTKTVCSKGDVTSVIQSQANNSNILKDLGVLASSVLLANCSIWVEGVTDKRYLQVYLKRFIDDLKEKSLSNSDPIQESDKLKYKRRYEKLQSYSENLHYVFVEYQGSNITHWAFTDKVDSNSTTSTPAKKLNKDILLIADADIESKGSRVADLESALGDRFRKLDWKEIENYIPHNVIINAAKTLWEDMKSKGNSTHSFDTLTDKSFRSEELGIGAILENQISKAQDAKDGKLFFRKGDGWVKTKNGDKVFIESSGSTIKQKVVFCDIAVDIMKSQNDDWALSEELSQLCDKIWSFIEECNS